MNNLIRELFDSDMCEARKNFAFTEEARYELKRRESLYGELREKLGEEELELFDKYLDTYGIVDDDVIFHAYVSGMRDLIRFASGIFM